MWTSSDIGRNCIGTNQNTFSFTFWVALHIPAAPDQSIPCPEGPTAARTDSGTCSLPDIAHGGAEQAHLDSQQQGKVLSPPGLSPSQRHCITGTVMGYTYPEMKSCFCSGLISPGLFGCHAHGCMCGGLALSSCGLPHTQHRIGRIWGLLICSRGELQTKALDSLQPVLSKYTSSCCVTLIFLKIRN